MIITKVFLPIFIFLLPTVVKVLFPNRRDAIEITGVTLPIIAFFVRFFVAKRHINSNQCSRLVRRIQFVALCVAILILVLIDSMMILAQELPNGALFATDLDVIVFALLIAMYLSCMAFALFPGLDEELVNVELPA